MEGSQGGSNSPAPFLAKTYEMVDDYLSNSVVSWSHNGQSFVVWNPLEFARDLLPKYFKHNNFSSFIRQLNTYGFRKVDPDQWEFANEEFIRGQRHLLKNIHRRKPIHSHSIQNTSNPLTETEREEFEKEIEKLKCDNHLLQLEISRYDLENQEYECEMKSIGLHTLKIAKRRREMVSFFGQLLQKPEVEKTHNRKRRILVSNYLCNEVSKHGDEIMNAVEANPLMNLELIEFLGSCLNFWENYIQEIDQIHEQEVFEFGVLPEPSLNIITGTPLLGNDSVGPTNEMASPCIEIGVNVDPELSPDNVLDHRVESSVSPVVQQQQTGANDVFWQQFLDETPPVVVGPTVGPTETSESIDCRRNRPWWNMNNVDSLAKQMEHLTPAERT